MAAVLKTVVAATSPGVRIPLPPPKNIRGGRIAWSSAPACEVGKGDIYSLRGFKSRPPRQTCPVYHVPVAQWIRALPCGGRGRAFESLLGYLNANAAGFPAAFVLGGCFCDLRMRSPPGLTRRQRRAHPLKRLGQRGARAAEVQPHEALAAAAEPIPFVQPYPRPLRKELRRLLR